jgi:hypothetical protein
MHEKIAILDGRILWHGSLNILASMRQPDRVERWSLRNILRVRKTRLRRKVDARRVERTGHGWRRTRNRTAFQSQLGAHLGAGGRPCPKPGCGGRLAERNGRNGRFLGCTNYPGCRYTENLK